MTLKKAEAELAEIDDEITKVMADYLSALYVDDVCRIDLCEERLAELKKLHTSAKQRIYRLRGQW